MGPSPNKLTGTPQKATAHFGGTISSSGTDTCENMETHV